MTASQHTILCEVCAEHAAFVRLSCSHTICHHCASAVKGIDTPVLDSSMVGHPCPVCSEVVTFAEPLNILAPRVRLTQSHIPLYSVFTCVRVQHATLSKSLVEVPLDASQAWGSSSTLQTPFPATYSSADLLLLHNSIPDVSTSQTSEQNDDSRSTADDEALTRSTENALAEFVVVDTPSPSRPVRLTRDSAFCLV